MSDRDKLMDETARDVQRLDTHARKPATLAGMVFYGGTLGLLLVAPVIGGAYLGRWLDTLAPGYSVRWTVSLIVLGIAAGAWNACQFIRRKR